MNITAVILTFNEEMHLDRCIKSLRGVVNKIVIVDCFSVDRTVEIALGHGAQVLQHKWVNHAFQFNWALTQLNNETEWVLRVDADEVLSPRLATEIQNELPDIESNIDGIYFGRRIVFQGKLIRHGGVFPVMVLRLFRLGRGQSEIRWMDEHIRVNGLTKNFNGEIIDNNLQSIGWWIEKHNKYSSYEALEMLNLAYGFYNRPALVLNKNHETDRKRWIKDVIYSRLPIGTRSFLYFIYRYIFRMGFLDGSSGTAFHFLQGFWYRYLVDLKIAEVKRQMQIGGQDLISAIENVLGVKI